MYPTKPPTTRVPMAPSADAARISWNAGRTVGAAAPGGRAAGVPVAAGGAVVIVTPPVDGSTYIVCASGRWRTTTATATAATPSDPKIRAAAIPLVFADAATAAPTPPTAPPVS